MVAINSFVRWGWCCLLAHVLYIWLMQVNADLVSVVQLQLHTFINEPNRLSFIRMIFALSP